MKKLAVALALVLAACSGGDAVAETDADSPEPTATTEHSSPDPTLAPEQSSPPQTQAPADEPSSGGEGSVIATIGDMTWEFDNALCFIMEGTPGEEGSAWSITNSDAFQVVLEAGNGDSIDVGGGPFSDDPDNDWDTNTPTFEVNGSTVVGTGTFTNRVNNETAEGTVTATCPDWSN